MRKHTDTKQNLTKIVNSEEHAQKKEERTKKLEEQ